MIRIADDNRNNIYSEEGVVSNYQKNLCLFESFYDNNVEWWKDTAANFTVIPVGQCNGKNYNFDEEGKGGFPSSHVIITGMSGSGKSILLHTMIIGSCIRYSPNELRLVLIDMNTSEFRHYAEEKIPHADIIANLASPEVGCHVLRKIIKKIDEREELFKEKDVLNYYSYRNLFSNEVLPRFLIIIDGCESLLKNDGSRREALNLLDFIIARGRGMGFNLILSSLSMTLPDDLVHFVDYKSEPYRIVMRQSQNMAYSLLGFVDERVLQLKVGQAIINAENTDLVQIYYLPNDSIGTQKTRNDYLRMINEKWNKTTQHNDILVFKEDVNYGKR